MTLDLTEWRFKALCLRMGLGYTWTGPQQQPGPTPGGTYTILTPAQTLDIICRFDSPPDVISQTKLAVIFKVMFRWHSTFNVF